MKETIRVRDKHNISDFVGFRFIFLYLYCICIYLVVCFFNLYRKFSNIFFFSLQKYEVFSF